VRYVVKTNFGNGDCFVTKNNSNRKPYTFMVSDPDTKIWKTRSAAEKWANLRNSCVKTIMFSVVEVE
jgi:hypothetical protein